MKDGDMDGIKKWAKAACVRAVKTAAQTAGGVIGAAAVMGEVQWAMVGSAAALAAVVSLLTSVAGMPEVEGGASVAKIAAKKEG